MSEQEPVEEEPMIRLKFRDGSTFEATPYNTELYNFIGKTLFRGMEVDAHKFDHVFLRMSPDNDAEVAQGSFIFWDVPFSDEPSEIYEKLEEYMMEWDYPMRLNQVFVPDSDKAAYAKLEDQTIAKAMSDIDDWGNDGKEQAS